MNLETIIKLFKKADAAKLYYTDPEAAQRVAQMIAEAEREACARVCDDAAFDWHFHASGGPAAHYKHCAAAIRARKEIK